MPKNVPVIQDEFYVVFWNGGYFLTTRMNANAMFEGESETETNYKAEWE
jgi:hypothetical protein